jgi:hypothetical protein
MQERTITFELNGSEIQTFAELLESASEHELEYGSDDLATSPIITLIKKLRPLFQEAETQAASPPYDVKSVDATQVACANRLFHDNPGHIPKNYGEYTDPLVGDQFGADGPPAKKVTTENRPKKDFGQPFFDD